jgi:3-oxoacyl-[acyl-carrier protein] reductase
MLITGTRRGIGRLLAGHYATAGYRVFGCGRSALDESTGPAEHIVADVGQEAGVARMFGEVKKRAGRLDVLICNAGVTSGNYLALTPGETIRRVLQTNFAGTFYVVRDGLKMMMRHRSGRIICISSAHVPLATPGTAVYGATKAAVEQMVRVVAREAGPSGVSINAVGLPALDGGGMAEELGEKRIEATMGQLPSKGHATIQELIHAIDFIISAPGISITGQVIHLGGA